MRVRSVSRILLCAASFTAAFPLGAAATGAPDGVAEPRVLQITLEDALLRATDGHADVRSADAARQEAAGRLRSASALAFNPEVGLEGGPARDTVTSSSTSSLVLRQTIELGGKRNKRATAAGIRLRAAESRAAWVRVSVSARVRQTYGHAMIAREALESAKEAEAIASELQAAAEQRLALGDGTTLELNVANAAAGRARAERLAAEAALQTARLDLAAAVGEPVEVALDPAASGLPAPRGVPDEADFIAAALTRRGDLVATELEAEAAEADVRVADTSTIPDLTLSLARNRNGVDDQQSTTLGLALPIPILNGFQGERATARALVTGSHARRDAMRQEALRQAHGALRRLVMARRAVEAFDRGVVDRLGENLTLALESFRSGKMGLLDLTSVRRELLESRVAYLDALRTLVSAESDLERAGGAKPGEP